ncbi:MAG: sigma-70 family RNA polymerase sigma factor [Candidatus Aminicenantes bacterium]|nr:sigma-70 family RNA polymerase sigma factor [Candidatus Aminicenantes bacterium]
MRKEKVEKLSGDHLKIIKKIIESKIKIYAPLDLTKTLDEFINRIQKDDLKAINEFHSKKITFDKYLEVSIRNFLIEKTYFHFLFGDQDLTNKFVIDICKKIKIPKKLYSEIMTFVKARLENKIKLEKVKNKFKEKSMLRTYFYSMARRSVIDYIRKNKIKEEVEVEPNKLDKLESPNTSISIKWEEKEIKERIETLDDNEKVILKLYYYKGVACSRIAIMFGTTAYKIKKTLEVAKEKILKGK